MADPLYLKTPQGREIAYHLTEGEGPCVVFLGGLKSDMQGTKAVHLEDWAQETGRAFLRFDYSGHGQSSGTFEEGCIGDWHADTLAAIEALTKGPIVPVGSSMGGWQALLLARARPDRLAGLVTIAAAPDFTEDGWWAGFDAAQRALLEAEGRVELPSDYMEPYIVTKRMIEDGRNHLVMRDPLELACTVRMLQGTADTAVSVAIATQLVAHAASPDMQLLLVKDADHRFSDGRCLGLIERAVEEVCAL
ncbi:alpha/beta hydrolase [Sulfitobacter guttiformis]|uniref:Palmitoyl-protein thioesterase ABHD10, mitochondrial n=1 Tax=Sulfitobacter guttiformis TaxID=74349 RepID=A0A420DJR1_9RHOB|nr:alpha/beta hydrolase [Sulfitobacter guttiformis]KIN71685.1 Alpha/beta hydrolase-like protein [Sulfitobacter guttiformis KCTC 32187]RKE94486.1 serine aminopeptidase S33 family [Sulfitobacter guttiformis]